MTTLKLAQANIVILANTFNPSIATKDWLLANVFKQEPVNFINTPLVSVYEIPALHLLIDQSRLQATCTQTEDSNKLNQCADVVKKYVEKLPHTPYKAIGFNYTWEVTTDTHISGSAIICTGCSCQLPSLENTFDSYAVGPVVIARKQDYLVRAAVEPTLDVNTPKIVNINYHYDMSQTQAIADKTNCLLSHIDDSKKLVKLIFEGCA